MLHPAKYDAHFVVHVGICDRIRTRSKKKMQNAYKIWICRIGWSHSTDHTLSLSRGLVLLVFGIPPDVIIRLQFPFFFIYSRPSSGLWLTNRKAFERLSKVLITLPWFSLFRSPLSLILSHTLHHFILFYFVIIKDSLTEHSCDHGVSIWQAVATKYNVQMRNRERERKKNERKKNQGSSSEQCHFLDDKAAVFKTRNAMQCPLLVLKCWQIIRRKATVRKLDDLHPGVRGIQSDRVQFHCVVRARSVCTHSGYHGVHTPTGPRSEWARLRNSARDTPLFLPISPLLDTFCNRRPLGLF